MFTLGQPIPADQSWARSTRRNNGERPAPEPVRKPSDPERPAMDLGELMERFPPRPARVAPEGVILNAETGRRIDRALKSIRVRRRVYEDWKFAKVDPAGGRTIVNLYGPPGVGKSLTGEAIAARLGRHLIAVKYEEIESRYPGGTSRNIAAAFMAARHTEAVLIFDEADAILGKRLSDVTNSADHAVNVARATMLTELEACTGVVIFTTNLLSNYDPAFMSRIPLHMEILPPDAAGRRKLWEMYVPLEVPGRGRLPWDELAQRSEGLVGREIRNAALHALYEAADRPGEQAEISTTELFEAIDDVQRAHVVGPMASAPRQHSWE
ncbi:MAG: ATP-binding protein [Planctomycetaceae bacterium]|nr:ATP-binding protein [Planctomycetaceae bacterium]